MKVGLLSMIDHPLLPYFLNACHSEGVEDLVVICDALGWSEKNQRIWLERTDGGLGARDCQAVTLAGVHSLGVPFYMVESHNDPLMIDLINLLGLDALANAGTPRKLQEHVINATDIGVINVHPGILPKYRGACAVEWAIYNDDPIANTAHFMNSAYDAGPVIAQSTVSLPDHPSYRHIRRATYLEGCNLMAQVLGRLQRGEIDTGNLDTQDEGEARLWEPLTPNEMADVLRKLENGNYQPIVADAPRST